ncbi:hypothetical protein PRIPAC_92456 [Pristionchus pacificus]|uniref:Zinc finger protein n=1 Tax=Pristionchus pacificus TaxID=54126 RepID=A0A2A6BBN8_PRIPA|nr:hypothetical protein PRIPAC_92456 [Pristionchus pacificus]|eukprot:PDM63287.1 zinc finger protein [Pristionchus pacificus]
MTTMDEPPKPTFFIASASNDKCAHCGAPPSASSGVTTPRDPSPAKEPKEPEREKRINNGWYLTIILGNNIDLRMTSSERFHFKKDYENFKVRVTATMFAALCYASIFPSRAADAICIFLAVWYYCTLTIRESILILNGSSIHWWWVAHHYLAAALAGITITWPEDEAYQEFRPQLGFFSMYICVVQQLQYQYQSGCLRRLHALGSLKSDMDVTLEGFASWMFHGLTFLLPFLFTAYLFELYNSYTLLNMWLSREKCVWQVIGLSALLATVGIGNLIMVTGIVFQKLAETPAERKQSLRSKWYFALLLLFVVTSKSCARSGRMPAASRRGRHSAAAEAPIPRVDTLRPRRAAAAAAARQPSPRPVTALAPTAAALTAAAASPPEDENEQRCAVCMEVLSTKRSVSLDPCKHEFHRTCAFQWLETRCCTGAQQCPLCRAVVASLRDPGQRSHKEYVRVFGDSGQPTKRMVLAHSLARLRVGHDRFIEHASGMTAPASATYLSDVVEEVEKLEQRAKIYKEMKHAWRAGAMRTPLSELPFLYDATWNLAAELADMERQQRRRATGGNAAQPPADPFARPFDGGMLAALRDRLSADRARDRRASTPTPTPRPVAPSARELRAAARDARRRADEAAPRDCPLLHLEPTVPRRPYVYLTALPYPLSHFTVTSIPEVALV